MIDAHAHLSSEAISEVVDEIIRQLREGGVSHVVLGGVSPGDWQRQLDLLARYPNFLTTAAGIHPWVVRDAEEDALEAMFLELKTSLTGFSLLGEVGFDFYRDNSKSQKLKQRKWCEFQLQLAADMGKPAVLHVVRGHDEMFSVLKNFPKASGIIHAFTGGPELAKAYAQRGFTISLCNRFFRGKAHSDFDWLKDVSFVIESDAPSSKDEEKNPEKIAQTWLSELRTTARHLSDALGCAERETWLKSEMSLKKILMAN